MPSLGAVILAAGAGTRLGGVAKALLASHSGTFLSQIIATARGVGLADAVVVVGPPYGEAIAAHARELGVRVVENAAPDRGMASSVAIGFAAISAAQRGPDGSMTRGGACDAAWLWPVDHPDVSGDTLRAIVGALAMHDAARPVCEGRRGHPPLVARRLFDQLAHCPDDGARAVLAAADVIDVEVDDPGCLRDVDTVLDLEGR